MSAGDIILDLATETGGNCTESQLDKTIDYKGIKIFGRADYADLMPRVASELYCNNIISFVQLLFNEKGEYKPDLENEIVKNIKQEK